ncbi:MAG: 2-oxo acid dehydrogenase subunit E2, partial [Firmicutes bacterium]|nr:2-oxo acid dehydrogenase subunit E2 [Bacillota bacterium]
MAFGDRRDGKRVKAPGLQTVMTALLPQRIGCEVYLNDKIDATELIKYLEKKNEGRTERKMTIFHCAITALARMLMERPTMNHFIQGWAIYERNEISLSFVARRTFVDESAEALLYFVPKPTDTVNEVSEWIMGEVKETRKSEVATGGVDELLDKFAAMPRFLMAFLIRIIRYLDFWGINPKFITAGDPNYSSILVSNLGSIKCPSVYHHLNNYGTNSVMVTIGTL